MKTIPIAQLQDQIILNLYNRLVDEKLRRGATLNTLFQDLKVSVQRGFLQAAADDLCDRKMVRREPDKRYVLAAAGIDYAQRQWGFSEATQSSSWTGNLDRTGLSVTNQQTLVSRLRDIQVVVEGLDIAQSEREQIRAHVVAAVVLAEAPEPPWQLILTILTAIASVATIATAVADAMNIIGKA